jgi:hypothetical protein
MRNSVTLYRGFINKDLRVEYALKFEDDTSKYPTVLQMRNGGYSINPNFSIVIGEGFERPQIFIPKNRYFQFISIFEKSTELIQKNLFELFPGIGSMEFEVDERTLQRFQTEQALSTNGITVMPCVWVDNSSTCHAGMRIETYGNSISIPLEDTIPMTKLFRTFDPFGMGMSLLRVLGKVE